MRTSSEACLADKLIKWSSPHEVMSHMREKKICHLKGIYVKTEWAYPRDLSPTPAYKYGESAHKKEVFPSPTPSFEGVGSGSVRYNKSDNQAIYLENYLYKLYSHNYHIYHAHNSNKSCFKYNWNLKHAFLRFSYYTLMILQRIEDS